MSRPMVLALGENICNQNQSDIADMYLQIEVKL